MYILSLRDSFQDTHHLTDALTIREATVSSNEVGELVPFKTLAQSIKGQRVLFLIHGYNNSLQDAFEAYFYMKANVYHYLTDHYDRVLGFLWPGGDRRLEYFKARLRANAVGDFAGKLLHHLKSHCQSLDVMAHSLGNRVAFTAIKNQPKKTVRHMFSMGAAVNNNSFMPHQEFANIFNRCQQLVVFSSKHDNVLKTFYQVAEGHPALGFSGPVKLAGMTPGLFSVDASEVVSQHSGYRRSSQVFSALAQSLVHALPHQLKLKVEQENAVQESE